MKSDLFSFLLLLGVGLNYQVSKIHDVTTFLGQWDPKNMFCTIFDFQAQKLTKCPGGTDGSRAGILKIHGI